MTAAPFSGRELTALPISKYNFTCGSSTAMI